MRTGQMSEKQPSTCFRDLYQRLQLKQSATYTETAGLHESVFTSLQSGGSRIYIRQLIVSQPINKPQFLRQA